MFNFFSSTERLKKKISTQLENYSKPNKDFFILISFSSAIISLGLILDNAPIIIGAMIIAPLITPFFGLALNLILFKKEFFNSLVSIFLGSLMAIFTSTIVGFLIIFLNNNIFSTTTEILARTDTSFTYLLVAILIGLIGTYAYAKPNISEKITGIAISATIVPPLSVIGLGLAGQNFFLIKNSFILFSINFLGIFIGSLIMFIILGFAKEPQN